MKHKKLISAIILTSMFINITAFASVLGSENITHSRLDIAKGTVLYTNTFLSDQSGVGMQSEKYVEYTPNPDSVPVLVSDEYLFGRRTVTQMVSSLMDSGIRPVMMMNSDFFSLQTGVPMSHQVENGILITKDIQTLDSVGINEDGTAFIAPLKINTTITTNENTIVIENFNKYRQPWTVYMLNDKFGKTTEATSPGINVIIGDLSGDITLNSSVTGVVERVFESEGKIEIPKGKIVLTADNLVPEAAMNDILLFKEGDEVTINTSSEGDERWADAKYALGCLGGRLIKNGEIVASDNSAAPRTAFGVKEDGSLIFYTIDGRQKGHSYGVKLQTLAKRMEELGCVDAVNLDGGGSTSIGIIYPGNDNFSIINKPSDGIERKVATFMGIYNLSASSGISEKLFIYPYSGNYLSGATETFTVLATDGQYHKVPTPENIRFTSPDGTKTDSPTLTITGDGEVNVSASDGSSYGSITLNCYRTPTEITVINQETKAKVNEINILCSESLNLSASARVGNKNLICDDSCFIWSADENLGTIDSNGYFTAADEPKSGKIYVTAGDFTKEISVNITSENDNYTEIGFEETSPGQVTINFTNANGVGIKNENIEIKADGKKIDSILDDSRINLVFSDELTHKISVVATNNASYTSMAFYTTKGNEYKNIFEDTKNHWAEKYISYMNNQKIVNGSIENGKASFRPGANVTRAEFAVMIANLLGINVSDYAGVKLKTNDANSIPSWAINHIKALSELKIMTGRQDGDKILFEPSAHLTRSEAATVISRILPDDIRTNKNIEFSDKNEIPAWAMDAFKKLYSLGVITGYEDKSVKPSGKITRAEAVKLLYEIY